MARLVIGNSTSQVVGLEPEHLLGLRDELSSEEVEFGYLSLTHHVTNRTKERNGVVTFKDAKGIPRPVLDKRFRPYKRVQDVRDAVAKRHKAFIKGHIVKRTTLLNRRGEFPTGLLKRALAWLESKAVGYTLCDSRKRPNSQPGLFKQVSDITPYPEQLECAKVAAEAGRGACVLPTGAGKSLVMCFLLLELQLPALIIVPNLSLKLQLQETFTKFFGSLENITVLNIDATSLPQITDVGVLIIDEAHRAAAQTYQNLNKRSWGSIFHRYYFTATPYRSKEAEAIVLESVIGEVIYRTKYADAVKLGRIVPIEAYYYTLPKQKSLNSTDWRSVYRKLVVENEYRNALIASLMKELHAQGQSTLCLVREIRHGDILQEMTGAGFANGESDDCAQLISWFSDGKLKSLIATSQVCGEGTDSRAAEWVIIACAGKSRNAFVQQCGRTFRRFGDKASGKVILFKDPSNPWLLDHYECQAQYLREEFGVEPVEIWLPGAI